jgi:hypothetical protein
MKVIIPTWSDYGSTLASLNDVLYYINRLYEVEDI